MLPPIPLPLDLILVPQPPQLFHLLLGQTQPTSPSIPTHPLNILTSIGALAELVKEGKIGGIGLSEVSAHTIRRAAKVHEIVAVEVELSLFTREPLENGIASICDERKPTSPSNFPFFVSLLACRDIHMN